MEFFYILDLFGTAAFAITGALKCSKYRLDIIGFLVLGLIAGVGGGTMREIILGHFPPFVFTDYNYLYVSCAASTLAFFSHAKLKARTKMFYYFDAIGLGVFTAVGCNAALQADMGFLGVILLGVLTAVGGGTIRDSLVGEIPLIFQKEIYSSAAIVGAIIFQVSLMAQISLIWAMVISFIITTGIRIAAIEFDWHLPQIKESA